MHSASAPESTASGRSPRRIAILGSRGIPAGYGGFETFAEELGARLARLGFEVTVYCPWRPGPRPTNHRGVRLEYVRAQGFAGASSLLYDALSLWRARQEHEVVYMLGYGSSPLCLLPRLFGREVWINMDGLEWRRSKWSLLARAWFRLTELIAGRVASRLVFDNQAVAEDVLGRLGKATEHVVIPYGAPEEGTAVDGAALERLGLAARDYYLVVARLEPENQIAEAIDAFERARTTRGLVVVTNRERTGEYARRTLARATERVRIVGPIHERRELQALREGAYAHLHGHTVGGTNPSLLEAMAAGGVVLAHDNPFNREVLGSGGLYYGSQADLEHQLEVVEALTPGERRRVASANRARVAGAYRWDDVALAYARLLDPEHDSTRDLRTAG